MGRLDDISLEELQELRDETEGEIPRERVLVAIARKQGDNLDRLAERHGVVEKTIRNWLDRFEEDPLEEAPYDAARSGRPSKLTKQQREELIEDFQSSPDEFGYNRQAWTSSLASHHIESKFAVEYTDRHVRYLMSEAGLSWRTARPRHTDADPEIEEEFKDTVQKNGEN
jgi:transposase